MGFTADVPASVQPEVFDVLQHVLRLDANCPKSIPGSAEALVAPDWEKVTPSSTPAPGEIARPDVRSTRFPAKAVVIAFLAAGLTCTFDVAPRAEAQGRTAQGLTIDASPALASEAERLRGIDFEELDRALQRAGLALPGEVRVRLIPETDPRTREIPTWVVGLAFGTSEIFILPQRVPPYPYDSIESVFRHEVAHLALTRRADGAPLPRWFHEGVAMSVDTGWQTSGQLRLLLEMLRNPHTDRLQQLFTSAAQPESALAYGLSAALVTDLQRRHGPAVVGAIAGRVASGVPFTESFLRETGETPDAAASRAWAVYRRWTNWVPALTSGSAAWALILVIAAAAYVSVRRRRARRRRAWDEEENPD